VPAALVRERFLEAHRIKVHDHPATAGQRVPNQKCDLLSHCQGSAQSTLPSRTRRSGPDFSVTFAQKISCCRSRTTALAMTPASSHSGAASDMERESSGIGAG